MDPSRPRPVDDVSAGDWLTPRLGPFGPAVGSIVPRGYEAYARVLHPVARADDPLVSWADVCASTGHDPHALMRWDDIAGVMAERVHRSLLASSWLGPEEGNLHPRALRRLCLLLEPHTSTAQRCFFALWAGYDWVDPDDSDGSAGTFCPHGRPSRRRRRPPRPPHIRRRARSTPDGTLITPPRRIARWHARRLDIPGRDYLLFSGPLDAATVIGWHAEDGRFWPQSPNLFWPDDHAWCVGSDVDLCSTVVGGTASLIASVVADAGLEAWPVRPDDWVS